MCGKFCTELLLDVKETHSSIFARNGKKASDILQRWRENTFRQEARFVKRLFDQLLFRLSQTFKKQNEIFHLFS